MLVPVPDRPSGDYPVVLLLSLLPYIALVHSYRYWVRTRAFVLQIRLTADKPPNPLFCVLDCRLPLIMTSTSTPHSSASVYGRHSNGIRHQLSYCGPSYFWLEIIWYQRIDALVMSDISASHSILFQLLRTFLSSFVSDLADDSG